MSSTRTPRSAQLALRCFFLENIICSRHVANARPWDSAPIQEREDNRIPQRIESQTSEVHTREVQKADGRSQLQRGLLDDVRGDRWIYGCKLGFCVTRLGPKSVVDGRKTC